MAENEATDGEVKKPSLVKKLMMPLVISVVVAGGTIGALHFMGILHFGEEAQMAESESTESVEEGAEGATDAAAGSPAFFFTFYPDMLVTLSAGSQAHYLKLSIQVMSREEEVVAGIEQFQPIMRNNLLKMFQEVDYDTVTGPEGVEALQVMAADEIRSVLKKYHGNSSIEGVYFSSFVVQ